MQDEDRPFHHWYRFVLSFPPHLVREYLERFGVEDGDTVLDPFCGTGTTLVECKKRGVKSVGVEASPLPKLVSTVKVDWKVEPSRLEDLARGIAEEAEQRLEREGVPDSPLSSSPAGEHQSLRRLDSEILKLFPRNAISPKPLHKVLCLLDCLDRRSGEREEDHLRVALASSLISSSANLRFGPEVCLGPLKDDAPVVAPWLEQVVAMASDLRALDQSSYPSARVELGDARSVDELIAPRSVSAVITSPPYPNEKDYSRTTRLETVLLGMVRSRSDLRGAKQRLLRSNTRGVYKADDDDRWVRDHPEIQALAQEIEDRRVALGKTSGFERLYKRVTTLYFGGMVRHLASLRSVLRPGAQLAYVVGDQASFLRVLIRTGSLLADLARPLGYEVVGTDLFRTRFASATRAELREEVLLLRWPGE